MGCETWILTKVQIPLLQTSSQQGYERHNRILLFLVSSASSKFLHLLLLCIYRIIWVVLPQASCLTEPIRSFRIHGITWHGESVGYIAMLTVRTNAKSTPLVTEKSGSLRSWWSKKKGHEIARSGVWRTAPHGIRNLSSTNKSLELQSRPFQTDL